MRMSRKYWIVALLLLAAIGAAGYYLSAFDFSSEVASIDESALEALKADFNRAAGSLRVIVLLAPT